MKLASNEHENISQRRDLYKRFPFSHRYQRWNSLQGFMKKV
jgi:hypothetical protein